MPNPGSRRIWQSSWATTSILESTGGPILESVEGQSDLSHLNLSEQRVEELVSEVRWLGSLRETGQVALLKTARGVDLTPLVDAGIRTLPELLRASECPEGLAEGIWHGLRMEAARWTSVR